MTNPAEKPRMVQASKVPLLCRRAFYADLAMAGAAVGMGSAADAAALAALAAAEPAPIDPDYADVDPRLIADLVAANHILAHNGGLDSFGHVSVRDPRNPHRYLQMQAIAPRDVTAADLITFDLDSNALNARGRPVYRERFIHGEIYKARADVNAVVHSHSPGVIPFGVTEQPLRAIFHNGHFLGDGAPVWEIRKTAGEKNGMLVNTAELGQSLARALGSGSVVLMRGHGDAVAGPDLKTTVFRAIYTEVNARLQMQAIALGGPINYLNQYEHAKSQNVDRPWDTWRRQVGAG
jgi:ribulose-5-phosphate 4-epimerase/fuculose-1-phosphate aldolase